MSATPAKCIAPFFKAAFSDAKVRIQDVKDFPTKRRIHRWKPILVIIAGILIAGGLGWIVYAAGQLAIFIGGR
jgi:hypothetical protein